VQKKFFFSKVLPVEIKIESCSLRRLAKRSKTKTAKTIWSNIKKPQQPKGLKTFTNIKYIALIKSLHHEILGFFSPKVGWNFGISGDGNISQSCASFLSL
jgi:hypothetical protein